MEQSTHKKNRKGRKFLTLSLFGFTIIVWIIVGLIKYFLLKSFNWLDIVESIMDNLLGVLPPIIIFNFLYEYLSQDYTNEEMSEKITESLMTSQESLGSFDDEAKKRFIKSSLYSLTGEEKGKMLYEHIDEYLEKKFDIRTYFNYDVDLKETRFPVLDNSDYYSLNERITYSKKYNKGFPKRFKLFFCMSENDLDDKMKASEKRRREIEEIGELENIFSEDLNISVEDLNQLMCLDKEAQKSFVLDNMQAKVLINGVDVIWQDVLITREGISITCEVGEVPTGIVKVDIGFEMPFPMESSKVLMLIREPTYSPQMRFRYPSKLLDVTTIAFFDNDIKVNEASKFANRKEFIFNDQWIMPLSGVIYLIEKKEK